MKNVRLMLPLMVALAVSAAHPPPLTGEDGDVFLEDVVVEGNRVTGERFIRSHLTFEGGRFYDFDDLIDEINVSRGNLSRTDLFSNIFFDDALIEDGQDLSVIITVRVREKNYLFFGPSGYFGYERDEWYADLSAYLEYVNLYGNGSLLSVEIPYYEDRGIILDTRNVIGPLTLRVGYSCLDEEFLDVRSHTATVGLGVALSGVFTLGSDVQLHSQDLDSLILLPFVDLGSVKRRGQDRNTWLYNRFTPYVGFNSDRTHFAGLENDFRVYRDLFLQIVNKIQLVVEYQEGDVPVQYTVLSRVRGSHFERERGSYGITLTDEFVFPWPFDPRFALAPFIDVELMGDGRSDALIGGGIGVHLQTRYQNPLAFQIGFGRGVMFSFTRRM